MPKSIQDRDEKLWPGNPAESRAQLQALVDREVPPLRALEETLRVQYEEPARAAAEDLALAKITSEELSLLRAERIHEQSYVHAVNSLLKLGKQTAALRARPREREIKAVKRRARSVERREETRYAGRRSDANLPTHHAPRPEHHALSSRTTHRL